MQNKRKIRPTIDSPMINHLISFGSGVFRTLFISLMLFITAPGHAFAYGGHHSYGYSYGHGYGHHGGHRSYGHRGHYRSHGGIGAAGYILIGALGFALISHVLNNNNDGYTTYRKPRVDNRPVYRQPGPYIPPARTRTILVEKPVAKTVFNYAENTGWDSLAKGNTGYALDVFAVQTQQNLNSGIPKIGFALAAASNGETDRAARAMRKAIRVDETALDEISTNQLEALLANIYRNYQEINNQENNTDTAFMLATLAYLNKDYATANEVIANNDQHQSAVNLRKLIRNKIS